MIISLLIVLGLLISYYCYQKFNRSLQILKTIPGPPTLPIFGNALDFVSLDKKAVWDYLQNFSEKYPRGKLMIFSKPMVVLRDPKDLQIYLSDPNTTTKGFVYAYFEDWLSDGVFTSKGSRWRLQRKLANAILTANSLIRYIKVINNCTITRINGLRSKGVENVYELRNLTSYLIGPSTFAAFGNMDMDKLDQDVIEKCAESIDIMTEVVTSRSLRPYLPRWCYFNKFTSYGRKNLASIDAFTKLGEDYLYKCENEEKYSDTLLKQGVLEKSDVENSDLPHDILLKAVQEGILDDSDINVFINNSFFGVYDTSRMTLAFMLLLLAENKEVQDKVRAEVTAVLEETGGKLETEDLKRLNYLEMCIKESLRLFPIAPMIFRYTERDVQLENQIIPAGTEVVIRIFDVHRDPKYWPEPNKYDPDRFLPDNVKERHPFAYIPFSAGPRNCNGQKFAMLAMKLVIGRLLSHFYLEPVDYSKDLIFVTDILTNTTKKFRAKFIRIDRDDMKIDCNNLPSSRCVDFVISCK